MWYRYTNKNNPMSDFGHAMFSDNLDSIQGAYGQNLFTYNGANSVTIDSLKDIIIKAWEQCQEEGFSYPNDDYYESLDAETIYNMLNPDDIVDSAEGWDSSFMITWFWQYIAEPNNIKAVITNDGTIVFDEDLIVRGI